MYLLRNTICLSILVALYSSRGALHAAGLKSFCGKVVICIGRIDIAADIILAELAFRTLHSIARNITESIVVLGKESLQYIEQYNNTYKYCNKTN
jgi:hypothetical protein